MLTACCCRAQTSNLTVLRVFGTGADTTFQLTLQPGTAGADGVTWPNGGFMLQTRLAHLLVHRPASYGMVAGLCGRNGSSSSPMQQLLQQCRGYPTGGWVQGVEVPDFEGHVSVRIGESI